MPWLQLRKYLHLLSGVTAAPFVLCTMSVAQASPGQAVVTKPGESTLEVGQALITNHAGRCLAILPMHVAEEALAPTLRYLGTQRAILGAIEELQDLGDDLAVGLVRGEIERNCGHGIGGFSRAVNSRLAESNQGSLRTVNGDGSFGYFPVSWIDDDRELYIRIVPTMANQPIRKGMSGSLLMSASQVPVGMLLNVSTRSGVGTVMRIDRLLERVERSGTSKPIGANPQASLATTPSSGTPTAQTAQFKIVSWSAPSAGPEHGTEKLNSLAEGDGYWLTEANHQRVTLELELPVTTLTRLISFDVSGLPPEQQPVSAEVLVSSGEAGRYRSAWGGALKFDEGGRHRVEFGESSVKGVKLVLYPQKSPTGHHPVGLKSIVIGP